MSFDQIIAEETLSLKSADVSMEGKDGKKYHFTVNELSPSELARCLDEFGDIDFLAIVYRSVRDEDGRRMSKEQANRLPADLMAKFISAYNDLVEDKITKKKSKKKGKA